LLKNGSIGYCGAYWIGGASLICTLPGASHWVVDEPTFLQLGCGAAAAIGATAMEAAAGAVMTSADRAIAAVVGSVPGGDSALRRIDDRVARGFVQRRVPEQVPIQHRTDHHIDGDVGVDVGAQLPARHTAA
jgi:hypothetical protein